jgi:hypothetical protein
MPPDSFKSPSMATTSSQSTTTWSSSTTVIDELMARTYPRHVHWNAFCRRMASDENATDDRTLEAYPTEDKDDEESAE